MNERMEKETIPSNINEKNDPDKCILKSLRMSLFGGNRIFNYLFHQPDREIDREVSGYKDGGIVFAKIMFFVSLFPFLVLLLSSWISNTLFLSGEAAGYLEDIPFIEQPFLFGVILFLSYLFFEKFRRFFLEMAPIIDFKTIGRQKYLDYLQDKCDLINGKGKYTYYKLGIYAIGIISIVWWVFVYAWLNITFPYDVWRFCPSYPLNYILTSAFYIAVLGFIILPVVWRLLSCAYILNRFCKDFKNQIKLIPLYPDGVGGLRPLGKIAFSFHLVLLTPIVHILISLFIWGVTGGAYLGFVYFPILIILFFLPLISSHDVMMRHKTRELHKLSKKYNELVNELKLFTDDAEDDDKDIKTMDKMDKIRNYYKDIENMPVWPFDLTIISRFLTSLLIPLFLMLIQIYVFN